MQDEHEMIPVGAARPVPFKLWFEQSSSLRRRLSGLWESGNPAFGFPLFHSPHFLLSPVFFALGTNRRNCGNVGISPPLRDFQGAVGRVENLILVFQAFHRAVISTVLPCRQSKRGGSGDSILHCRNSFLFASPIWRAHSVSLLSAAVWSIRSKLMPFFKYLLASAKDFNFSYGVR